MGLRHPEFSGLLFYETKVKLDKALERAELHIDDVYETGEVFIIGNCLSATSLIVVGSMLADVEWKGLFSKGMAQVTLNRLMVMPLIVLFGCRFLRVDEQITWIAVLLIGMPVASTCAVLARKYDQDYILASKTILVTTILSVFTLPVLSLF